MIPQQQRAEFTEQLRRRRGRPRRRTAVVVMSVKLPEDVYDALCRMSLEERASLNALANQALATFARARHLPVSNN